MTWLIKTTGLVPLLLAILTVFGLRTTLLGSSKWYLLSWISMVTPPGAIVWALGKSERSEK